jgi:hypothetical protein
MPVEKVYDIIKKDLGKKNKENSMISRVPSEPIMTDDKSNVFNKAKRLFSDKKQSSKEQNEEFSRLLDSAIKYIESSEDKEKHTDKLEELNKANSKFNMLMSLMKKGALPSADDKKKIEEISKEISGESSKIVKTVSDLKKMINDELSNIKTKHNELISSKDIQRFHTASEYLKVNDQELVSLIKHVSGRYGTMADLDLEAIKTTLNVAWNDLSSVNNKLITQIAALAPKGYGQGEFFIEFVFDDAKTAGGSVSYDISAGSKHYEVKCYPNINSVIRLGVEGTLTGFEAYHKLAKVYNNIKQLLVLFEDSLESPAYLTFENMCVSSKDKLPEEYKDKNLLSILKQLFSSRTDKDDSVTLSDKLNSGEFSASNIEATQEVFDIFELLVNSIYDNSFEYVKLMKQNQIFPVKKTESGELAIDINKDGSATIQTNPPIDKSTESKVIEAINALRVALLEAKNSAGGQKFLEYFRNSISSQIDKDFEQHPMILMNSNITGQSKDELQSDIVDENSKAPKASKNSDMICFGVYTKFEFKTISQKGVKVSVVE